MTKLRKKNKLVFGVGINNADYNVYKYDYINGKQKRLWICPFYKTWKDMLKRCYSEKACSRQPTYRGCRVCDEWLTFSNFKRWMEQQDWEDKDLDKDLLVEGNKIYSSDTCIFVDQMVNKFVNANKVSRGEYMIGVSWDKSTDKFLAECRNPFTGKKEHIGRFTDELEGHLAWKKRKHELACQLADSEYCNDPRLAEVLRKRYL